MDNRKISICIPSWNRYQLTIDSVIQVIDDSRISEIVIVDDCSTNGEGVRLQESYSGNPKVKFYTNPVNLDCYRNKHEAVHKASNEWCILFDSDNVLTTQYIDTLFAISDWDKQTIYQPSFARPHFDFRPHAGITFTYENIADYIHTNVMTAMNAMNFFINRSEYLRVWDGSIDPVTSDSIYFNYCWLLARNKFYITPGLEYDHLVHRGHYQDNVHRTGNFHNELLEKIRHIRNHMPQIETVQESVIEQVTNAVEVSDKISMDTIYAAYVNLSIRPDRNEHMIRELTRVGLPIERFNAFTPDEVYKFIPADKLQAMERRGTRGAIGCHYGQVAIMEEALKRGQSAWVQEDDLVYCDDIQDRLKVIFDYLNTHEWDIFWLGGTYHKDATWHKSENGRHTHPDLQMCTCTLNRDWEPTDNQDIVRTYGAFSTHSYIVNVKSLPKILDLLDQNVYRSMGIDWIMLLIQPELHTFAHSYGCAKQFDNQSNIGSGISYFSGFVNLGSHWFLKDMKDANR